MRHLPCLVLVLLVACGDSADTTSNWVAEIDTVGESCGLGSGELEGGSDMPMSTQVDDREDDDPHGVDEMPVPRDELGALGARVREAAR